jgi:hypothetical protein
VPGVKVADDFEALLESIDQSEGVAKIEWSVQPQ